MGARDPRHVFMPHKYVFPGGGVDEDDERLQLPVQLPSDVLDRLTRAASVSRARALALAAIRETFEETGLIVGQPCVERVLPKAVPTSWQSFFEHQCMPSLDKLAFVGRAITPEGPPRRFDARFLMIDARHVHGTLAGSGELHDLDWYSLDHALKLPLGEITELVLRLLQAHLSGTMERFRATSPMYWALNGVELVEHL